MAKSRARIKYTYEDYKSLPESETKRYELLQGELIMVPSPRFEHQRVSRDLGSILWEFVREHDLGVILHAPFDVHFVEADEDEVVQPDILYVSKERSDIITEEEIQGVPDLVVEIISPGTEGRDRGYKKTLYARHGVREYWLVDPETKTVEVLTLGRKGQGFETLAVYQRTEVLHSPLLKELEVDLQEIF
ncbi:MAG: Uma2 family endonuclease [Candidatus Bipolaricaulia bacterium]